MQFLLDRDCFYYSRLGGFMRCLLYRNTFSFCENHCNYLINIIFARRQGRLLKNYYKNVCLTLKSHLSLQQSEKLKSKFIVISCLSSLTSKNGMYTILVPFLWLTIGISETIKYRYSVAEIREKLRLLIEINTTILF